MRAGNPACTRLLDPAYYGLIDSPAVAGYKGAPMPRLTTTPAASGNTMPGM